MVLVLHFLRVNYLISVYENDSKPLVLASVLVYDNNPGTHKNKTHTHIHTHTHTSNTLKPSTKEQQEENMSSYKRGEGAKLPFRLGMNGHKTRNEGITLLQRGD